MRGREPALSVSCLIPAYNEAARIGAVLDAVLGTPEIDEVIVIDDASRDETKAVAAARAGVRLIRHSVNTGKTRALEDGLRAARGDLILLLDADLVGLGASEIGALIAPVRTGRADMSISLRKNAPALWRVIGLDYISGERVFHRALLMPHAKKLKSLPKFGFEVFLNSLVIDRNLRVAVVRWPQVESPLKGRKYGIWKGILGDLGMLRDIFRTVPLWAIIRQIHRMRRLRVRAAQGKA